MLAKIIDFLIMMKKGEGDKFRKDQNLDLKSETCTGSCDDNIVEIQYIFVVEISKVFYKMCFNLLYTAGLDINFFTHLSIRTSDYDNYLSENKFCLSKKFQ